MKPTMSSVIGSIYDCADHPEGWNEVLPDIAALMQGNACVFNYYTPGGPQAEPPEQTTKTGWRYGVDEDLNREYETHWAGINPWVHATKQFFFQDLSNRRYTPAHTSSLVDPAFMRKTEVFHEYMKKQDFADCTVLPIADDNIIISLSIFRSHRQGFFDRDSLNRATMLTSHIQRSFAITQKYGKLQQSTPDHILDSHQKAAILVTGDLLMIDANQPAQDFVLSRQDVGVTKGKISLGNKNIQQALKYIFHQESPVTDLRYKHRYTATLTLDDAIRVHILRVNTALSVAVNATLTKLFMLVFDTAADGTRAPVDQTSTTALTRTEEEIVTMLLQGFDLTQISKTRNTSPSTTRWHLKQIFSKLGIQSQRELILHFSHKKFDPTHH